MSLNKKSKKYIMSQLNKLFELLFEKTGLKQVTGRPYGHIHYAPSSAIAVRVKKKSISIEFYTDGRSKNSLTPDEHIKWANESGILRRELFSGGFFVLRRGVKNDLKSTLIYELSLESEDSLSNQDLLYELVGVINSLKQDLDSFVTPKSKVSSNELSDDSVVFDNDTNVDSEAIFEEVIDLMKVKLDSIIDSNRDEFIKTESFKVRPGVAYDKFYLNHVTGTYDCSLQGLIHHLLWENKCYHKFLPSSQLAVAEKVIKDDPEGIFAPDEDDESMEPEEIDELDSNISNIFHEVCKHVGTRLQALDFFDSSDFIEAGFLEDEDADDDDDDDDEMYDEDNVDKSLAEELVKKVCADINNCGILKKSIISGKLESADLSIIFDWAGFSFDFTLTVSDREDDELSFDEEDSINDIISEYFDQNGHWEEFDKANLPKDQCGGFRAEIA
jgi:hypothetical protein